MRCFFKVVAAALVVPLFFPAAVLGQQAEPDTLPVVEIAPVMVEVFRAPLRLDNVPYAASVVTERQIREGKPGLALDEALRGVPGVQVDNRHIYALGERISIRGFGARSQFGVRGIKVVTDGIPATFADGQTGPEIIDPSMLSRVEVIRGPASALYGNSAGGVISFREAPPATVPLHQRYRLLGGENGLRRAEALWSGMSGAVDYRLGVSHFGFTGFREHSAAEHLRASGQLGYAVGGGRLRLMGAMLDFDAQNPGALTAELFQEAPHRASPMNIMRQTGKEGRQRQLGLAWAGPIGTGDLELITYGITRFIRNPIVPTIIDLDRHAGGFRGAYRGALGTQSQWIAGLDMDFQRDDRQNYVNADGEPGRLTRDQLERVRNTAPFAHISTSLSPVLHLMGGLRYDHFRFSVEDRLPTAGGADESGERMMAAWSPSVGVSYDLLPTLSVYGNVATAFETPTTTELANRPEEAGGFNPDLDPQRTVSYEIGTRGTQGSAGYQISVYHADVRNALIPFEVLNVPGRTFFRNAGSARHRGVEASGWVQWPQGMTAQLSYTRTQAVFRDYEVRGVRHDGNLVPGVAPHRLEATLLVDMPAGVFVGVEGRYSSSTPADDANTDFASAYTVMDLRAGLREWSVRGVEVGPFVGVNNLLDRRYAASIVPNVTVPPGGSRAFYEPGPGRALYLGVQLGAGR